VNIVALSLRKEGKHGIMRSALNRHAPIALQRAPRRAYFQGFVHRFVGRVMFGLSGGADTIQPPL
jgi:hypothetical protein